MEKNYSKNRELFSSVTHEIKNSLNPVINLSGILLRGSGNSFTDDENSYLEVIERNGKKILYIMEELSFIDNLSYSKKSNQNEKQNVESHDELREILDNSLLSILPIVRNTRCSLVSDIDFGSSFFIPEKDVLCRMLENICLFFLSSGDDIPLIYFKTISHSSNLLLTASLNKSDDSINDLMVFDKYKIIEKGYSASSVLWLEFASICAGHLNGEALFSIGCKGDVIVSFSIPCKQNNIKNSDEGEMAEDFNHRVGREFIMLVIDDDIDNIIPVNAIIEHEFKGLGKVYHAENGGRGLDLLEKIKPDIILLDLTLPDISGLSLVRNIKNLFVKDDIPVIAFTALDIANDREKLVRSGFNDVIRKPFNIGAFIQIISKWIK